MSLLAVIAECGGIKNIDRILSPDSRIIIEIRDFSLLTPQSLKNSYHSSLKQLTYYKAAIADDAKLELQLLQAGRLIAQRQLEEVQPYLMPVYCPHRPDWHVSPPQGLLNDPNGFIYHQGQYHLFYQLYPYACEHKDKYWAHLISEDLLNWQWQPIALTPSDWFDSHGVFSGHALSQGEDLLIFYTGNVRIGEQRDRQTMQCLATSHDGVNFTKHGPVIHELPPGVTAHCRDPKIIRYHDHWLMLLGVQTEDEIGRLAIYQSDDLKKWNFVALCGDELGDFGYMWECPDLFTLNNQNFIVICPQGIKSDYLNHTVPHHNCILKAALDSDGKIRLCDPQPLDHGFDFYAPQSLQTIDGRRVMCAWMGLPDEVDHPSVDNGWIHQLTTLRELSYENGQLVQRPITELQSLRGEIISIPAGEGVFDLQSKKFELKVTMQWGSSLQVHQSESGYCEIRLDKESKKLYLDRSNTLIREGDTVRELSLDTSESVQLQILSDNSSLELFINNGAAVMSARIFTSEKATAISRAGQVDIDACWLLHSAASPFVNSQE
jgi:beta-fructofuranosidase